MSKKQKVLFVGSFQSGSKTGHVGGQMFACNSLIQSDLKQYFDFILLDTTATTNLHRPFLNRLYYAGRRMLKYCVLLLYRRPETVLAFTSYGAGFLEKGLMLVIAKTFGKKTVIAPRSGFLLDDLERSVWFRKVAKFILKRCDRIICQGRFWKAYFHKELDIPQDKLSIIYNWIDHTLYDHSPKEQKDTLQVLFMGWVERNKGIYDLIPAMKALKQKNICWHIAGEGKDLNDFITRLKTEGVYEKVHIHGWVTGADKRELLHQSDVLVIPSYREGLPNILLEGMASGCAIVASSVGAIPDVIEEGFNGFLIQPGESDKIWKCLMQYEENKDLLLKHAMNAYSRLLGNHSIDQVADKMKIILFR